MRTKVKIVSKERGQPDRVRFKFLPNKGLAVAYIARFNKHYCPPVTTVPDYYTFATL